MERRHRRAFTLVEVLVVIAILAVLAGILFPVFTQTRATARGVSCLSNIRQIGLALHLYAQDADEYWPRMDGCVQGPSPLGSPATGCDDPYGQRVNHYKWPAWVLPYTGNVDIFLCPSRQRDPTNWERDGEIYNGYALNLSVTGSTNTWNRPPTALGSYRNSFTGGALAGLWYPAETFLVMEHWFPGVWSFVTPSAIVQTAYPLATREVWDRALRPFGTVDPRAAPHRDGFNLAFCDGHARYMSVASFLSRCPPAASYQTETVPRPYPADMVWTIRWDPYWWEAWPLWGLRA